MKKSRTMGKIVELKEGVQEVKENKEDKASGYNK